MHGCPPHEIEAICRYMLEEKSLNTFVKLNPTLLGFDRVREILDTCGFDYLTVKPESFEHDLKLDQAKAMLHRLVQLSRDKGLSFGVKLTNTLGAVNGKGVLPGEEFYMSGRALFPLSINVARSRSTSRPSWRASSTVNCRSRIPVAPACSTSRRSSRPASGRSRWPPTCSSPVATCACSSA